MTGICKLIAFIQTKGVPVKVNLEKFVFWVTILIFFYLKLIFPYVLHLEYFSSCGQFLGRKMWQEFRLETALSVVFFHCIVYFRKRVLKSQKQQIRSFKNRENMISVASFKPHDFYCLRAFSLPLKATTLTIRMSDWKGWNTGKCAYGCRRVFASVTKTACETKMILGQITRSGQQQMDFQVRWCHLN